MDSFDVRKKRAATINAKLKKLFPAARCALTYSTPWELLVAVILSAQCTDTMVNTVTPGLFKKYPTIERFAKADPKELGKDIYRTGFFNNKARNIIGAAQTIIKDFGGEVPRTMEEMLTIPGVARKTANVVLGNAYGIVAGMAVDTHVKRFAQKFGLTAHSDPVKIERDLVELLPREEWFPFTYRLIDYGRNICIARPHECADHPITKLYPKAATTWPKAK